MDLDSQNADPNKPLQFYCRDCDLTFESLPDGTGFEQTPCPKCEQIAMTVEFENQEIDRQSNEATFFSFLGSLTGLFSMRVPNRARPPKPPQFETIVRYEDQSLAESDAEFLRQSGITAELSLSGAGTPDWFAGPNVACIELQVPAADARRAEQLLRDREPALVQIQEKREATAEVTFACEECGGEITFPGELRGKVEICPHCQEYVDVPQQ